MTAPNLSQYFSNDPPSLFDQISSTTDSKSKNQFLLFTIHLLSFNVLQRLQ